MREGVDYAWARPSPTGLRAAGKTFVMRYAPFLGDLGKGLTAAELKDLRAAGLAVGVVWETTSTRALDGYQAGAADAQYANQQMKALGWPADRPIYFAVDFDVDPIKVVPYFQGVCSEITYARAGCYGSYRMVDTLAKGGLACWGWQTYAWSGGRWTMHSQVQQYLNGQTIGGGVVDLCRAVDGDAGLWEVDEMTPEQAAQLTAVYAFVTGGTTNPRGVKELADWNTGGSSLLEGYLDLRERVAKLEQSAPIQTHTHPLSGSTGGPA